jgi:hypothetical protein
MQAGNFFLEIDWAKLMLVGQRSWNSFPVKFYARLIPQRRID